MAPDYVMLLYKQIHYDTLFHQQLNKLFELLIAYINQQKISYIP